MTSAELRALATRLQDRFSAPSLEGYDLVHGLRAAADLLDGLPGPAVHDDLPRGVQTFPPKVPLRSLL